jgi:hypothetical protein
MVAMTAGCLHAAARRRHGIVPRQRPQSQAMRGIPAILPFHAQSWRTSTEMHMPSMHMHMPVVLQADPRLAGDRT